MSRVGVHLTPDDDVRCRRQRWTGENYLGQPTVHDVVFCTLGSVEVAIPAALAERLRDALTTALADTGGDR